MLSAPTHNDKHIKIRPTKRHAERSKHNTQRPAAANSGAAGIIADGELVEQGLMADLGSCGSLEERFLEVVGYEVDTDPQISWLGE